VPTCPAVFFVPKTTLGWRKPEFLEILKSNIPLRAMGEKLGVSISQAHGLKYRARRNRKPAFVGRL
jgi:hypothetical protein